MTKDLSGTVVVFVAGGILTLILLFIFVKRQIMRFALRSRRGPHVPIGHDSKKVSLQPRLGGLPTFSPLFFATKNPFLPIFCRLFGEKSIAESKLYRK